MSMSVMLRTLSVVMILSFMVFPVSLKADVRTINTKFGAVNVDGAPKRVVTLYEGALDAAIAVGVTSLGAVNTRSRDGVAEYIQDKVPDIAIVGSPREINLEAVIALKPDLILAAPTMNREQFQLLSAVAPTIVPDVQRYQSDSWKKESLVYAQSMSKTVEMAEVIYAVEQQIEALKTKLAPTQNTKGKRTAMIRWMPQGAMLMAPGTFASTLLTAVGFEITDAGIIKPGRPHSSPLSQEKLSLIDRDWLFIATLDEDAQEALAAAKQSPAFERLEVVQKKKVFAVDGTLWSSANGPLAAAAILQQIETMILNSAD